MIGSLIVILGNLIFINIGLIFLIIKYKQTPAVPIIGLICIDLISLLMFISCID